MNVVFAVLGVQALLGLVDNFWNHEWRLHLPARRGARMEMALHAARHFLYAVVFGGLAWFEWHGAWALVFGAVLVLEFAITVADFLEEDRTRAPLPALERVLHTVLTVLYGVFLALIAPVLWSWWLQPGALHATGYGMVSVIFTACAAGVLAWGVRDLIAALQLAREPAWVRHPYFVGTQSRGETVVITGATGFIGRRLVRTLLARGYQVIAKTRDSERAADLFGPYARAVNTWDEIAADEPVVALVNLAGAPVLGVPWFRWRRRQLIDSRVRTTRQLVAWLSTRKQRPAVLVSASAVGYYGAVDAAVLDERDGRGREFQSRLCRAWEASAIRAEGLGVRVCRLRLGLVLGRDGGAYAGLTRGLRLKAGLLLGSGQQWCSWIHIDDAVNLFVQALEDSAWSGAINAVAPEAVRHERMMRTLARALRASIIGRVPAIVLRALLGESATLLVDGQHVVPGKALALGTSYRFPTLDGAVSQLETYAPASGKLDIYYNGACPVCQHEMSRYRALARHDASLRFCDITLRSHLLDDHGLEFQRVESRLHVRTAGNQVLSGMDAVRAVWCRLPGFRHLARLSALPGLRLLSDVVYDTVIAPLMTLSGQRQRRRCAARERGGHALR